MSGGLKLLTNNLTLFIHTTLLNHCDPKHIAPVYRQQWIALQSIARLTPHGPPHFHLRWLIMLLGMNYSAAGAAHIVSYFAFALLTPAGTSITDAIRGSGIFRTPLVRQWKLLMHLSQINRTLNLNKCTLPVSCYLIKLESFSLTAEPFLQQCPESQHSS